MTYNKLIKKILHKYWRTNSSFFGWYYKMWYLQKIAKPLKLKSYTSWKRKRNKRNRNKPGKRKASRITKSVNKKLRPIQLSCGICGVRFTDTDKINIDHIKPLSKGGTNDLSNLQLAHVLCNHLKGNNG